MYTLATFQYLLVQWVAMLEQEVAMLVLFATEVVHPSTATRLHGFPKHQCEVVSQTKPFGQCREAKIVVVLEKVTRFTGF